MRARRRFRQVPARSLRRAAIALGGGDRRAAAGVVGRGARRVVPARAPRAAARGVADGARRAGARAAPGRDGGRRPRELGAARRDLAAPASTRRSPARIAASGSTRASIPSASCARRWLDLRAGARRSAARRSRCSSPGCSTRTRGRCAGKLARRCIAGRLERALSKREILEQYLNRVYYGNGAWGVEAAARLYFGKPAAALSLGEAALLAVLPRGPRRYDPFRHLDAAIARRRAHPRR